MINVKRIMTPTKFDLKRQTNIIREKNKDQGMIEIAKDVYIGNSFDYEKNKNIDNMNFINACKHPYWVEYSNNKCTNGLFGYENNRLICNLVDAQDVNYISREIIEECIKFIEISQKENKKILINCNQGVSRSATIGLLYLIKNSMIEGQNFNEIIEIYKKVAPRYNPNLGMLNYARKYYSELKK